MVLSVYLAGFSIDRNGLENLKDVITDMAIDDVAQKLNNYIDELPAEKKVMQKKHIRQTKQFLEEITTSTSYFNAKKGEALKIIDEFTPETLSAAYARISRDGRPLPELRKDAREDVEASRKSNNIIIFGLGHKSVAEHAYLNFDIMGLSRRVVETVEAKRLQAYTEKSQRYVTMNGDFVMPKEIMYTPFESEFRRIIDLQNSFYMRNLDTLINWHKIVPDYADMFKALHCDSKPAGQLRAIEGFGKEDARYTLSMATEAQFGMSASARNIEILITKLRSSDVEEEKELGEKLFDEVDGVAPSVIKYVNPVDYFSKTRKQLEYHVEGLILKHKPESSRRKFVVNMKTNLARDISEPAGIIFSSSSLPYDSCLNLVNQLSDVEKNELLNTSDRYQEAHDPKIREYELGDRVFELIMSSSAFAQMKRHRMNTIIPQRYITALGHTTPESVKATGLTQEFENIIKESTVLSKSLVNAGFPVKVSEYILTNAHKRRILYDANNRQIHAFCMERQNLPAQWDIRNVANELAVVVKEESPLMLRSLTGKDKFYQTKAKYIK